MFLQLFFELSEPLFAKSQDEFALRAARGVGEKVVQCRQEILQFVRQLFIPAGKDLLQLIHNYHQRFARLRLCLTPGVSRIALKGVLQRSQQSTFLVASAVAG